MGFQAEARPTVAHLRRNSERGFPIRPTRPPGSPHRAFRHGPGPPGGHSTVVHGLEVSGHGKTLLQNAPKPATPSRAPSGRRLFHAGPRLLAGSDPLALGSGGELGRIAGDLGDGRGRSRHGDPAHRGPPAPDSGPLGHSPETGRIGPACHRHDPSRTRSHLVSPVQHEDDRPLGKRQKHYPSAVFFSGTCPAGDRNNSFVRIRRTGSENIWSWPSVTYLPSKPNGSRHAGDVPPPP